MFLRQNVPARGKGGVTFSSFIASLPLNYIRLREIVYGLQYRTLRFVEKTYGLPALVPRPMP